MIKSKDEASMRGMVWVGAYAVTMAALVHAQSTRQLDTEDARNFDGQARRIADIATKTIMDKIAATEAAAKSL